MAAICTCLRCKSQFESRKSTAKYCPSCRVIINRERSIERTRQIREEYYNTERVLQIQRAETAQAEHNRKLDALKVERMKKLQAAADGGDLIAALTVALNEPDHLHNVSYWKALQDYELDGLSPGNDYTVNNVSVYDPDFPQKIIASLESAIQIASHYIRNAR